MKLDINLRSLETIDIALVELKNLLENKSVSIIDGMNDQQKNDLINDIDHLNKLLKARARSND